MAAPSDPKKPSSFSGHSVGAPFGSSKKNSSNGSASTFKAPAFKIPEFNFDSADQSDSEDVAAATAENVSINFVKPAIDALTTYGTRVEAAYTKALAKAKTAKQLKAVKEQKALAYSTFADGLKDSVAANQKEVCAALESVDEDGSCAEAYAAVLDSLDSATSARGITTALKNLVKDLKNIGE